VDAHVGDDAADGGAHQPLGDARPASSLARAQRGERPRASLVARIAQHLDELALELAAQALELGLLGGDGEAGQELAGGDALPRLHVRPRRPRPAACAVTSVLPSMRTTAGRSRIRSPRRRCRRPAR
jgi:hypothetical protein